MHLNYISTSQMHCTPKSFIYRANESHAKLKIQGTIEISIHACRETSIGIVSAAKECTVKTCHFYNNAVFAFINVLKIIQSSKDLTMHNKMHLLLFNKNILCKQKFRTVRLSGGTHIDCAIN